MKAARGGKEKVKELNYKEHRDLKSSVFQLINVKWPAWKRGFSQWLCFCFFTLSTHTSSFFNQGNLLCLALLIFRGKGVGGGNRRLMRLCQMRHSREAVGIIYLNSALWSLILTPAVPSAERPSSPPCPRGPRKSKEAWEQEGSRAHCGMLSSSTA